MDTDEKSQLLAGIEHLEQNDATNQKMIQDLLNEKNSDVDDWETNEAICTVLESASKKSTAEQEAIPKRTGGFGSTGQ